MTPCISCYWSKLLPCDWDQDTLEVYKDNGNQGKLVEWVRDDPNL